jgi:hypothetical protein
MATILKLSRATTIRSRIQTPEGLTAFWGALLIFLGLIYRTNDIALASPALESSRQMGSIFIVAQLCVILYAIVRGLELQDYWKAQSGAVRALLAVFLTTFWVSSLVTSKIPIFSMILSIGVVIQILFAVACHYLMTSTNYENLDRMRTVFAVSLAAFALVITQFLIFETLQRGLAIEQFSIPGFISVRLFGC